MSAEGCTYQPICQEFYQLPEDDDLYSVYVYKEDWEEIQAWVCGIWNVTRGQHVLLRNEQPEYIAHTWQDAAVWFANATAKEAA